KLVQTYEGERTTYEIVGVSENYHFASIKSEIDPILLYNDTNPNWIILKTQAQSQEALLKALKEAWKSTKVDAPFIFTFIDKEVEKLYAEEKRLSQISLVFTILAIFISCLGLFGLVSYFAEQKKKEIGIRKVLGANINSVIKLLTADFVKLVGIAFLIAIPVSYYIIQLWLQDFSYHIDIEWWVFALSGSFAMMITLLTVGFQSLKSAMANPIHSLRTE
ncbi:MAG: FtsX-like permease family protein, partial [Bacteroidota bacterium]